MISDAFKSAYVNETGQQMQGIGTLTTSAKNIGTAVLGALGFSGALGEGLMAKGAQHALAGKIGGVGGSIMLATLEEKKSDTELNNLIRKATDQQLSTAFTDVANTAKTKEEFDRVSTVWDKIYKMREQELQKQMLRDVGTKIKEGEKE